MGKARAFYEDFLGYQEAFTLRKADGPVQIVFIKINDQQYVALLNEPNQGEGQLNHLGLYTDSMEQMREYLASRGVQVPDKAIQNRIGNRKISVVDPDGHMVELVQYMADSWTGKDTGKHLPDTRISDRMMHAGIWWAIWMRLPKFTAGLWGAAKAGAATA